LAVAEPAKLPDAPCVHRSQPRSVFHLKHRPVFAAGHPALAFLALAAVLTIPSRAADEYEAEPEPLPAVVAYAEARKIPLTGLTFDEAPSAQPMGGDTVTLLLTLREEKKLEQWLISLVLSAPTRSEVEAAKVQEATITTSTGAVLNFPFTPAAVDVSMTGPFRPGSGPPDTSGGSVEAHAGRAIVNGDFLKLGVEPYCRSALDLTARMKAAGLKSLRYTGGSKPAPAEWQRQSREDAAKVNLTESDERLAYSVYFALRTFFDAANKIPESRGLLERVLAKPSAFSIARHLGVYSNFQYGWQNVSTVPSSGAPLYTLPLALALNDTPAVNAFLLVSAPTPPLEASAGIIGIRLFHPKTQARNLYIRALSSHRGSIPLDVPAGK
jgi:hypothetical protein